MDATLRFRRSLALRLLQIAAATGAGAAAAAVGCGGNVVVDPTGEGSGGAGGAPSVTIVTTTTGPFTTSVTTTTGFPTGVTSTSTGMGPGLVSECFPWNESTPCPQPSEALPWLQQDDCTNTEFFTVEVVAGPYGEDAICCYDTIVDYCAIPGRPFVAEGRAQHAAATRGAGWGGALASRGPEIAAPAPTPEERAALAEAWARDGLLEHASIASFGRFALELLAAGAPAELIEAAHRAALDEVRHARLCMSLASAYGGAPVSPGPFPFGGAVAVGGDLAALAVATLREGCVGEAVAAVLAAEQLAGAVDPAAREALAAIAEDEARHAELAFRTVAWALREGGAGVRAAVVAAIGEAARRPVTAEGVAADPTGALAAHGRLTEAAARTAAQRAMREVVLPCLEALLGDA